MSDSAKTRKLTPLEMVSNMRDWLDVAEKHLKRKQLYSAYKAFDALQSCSYIAKKGLSKKTLKAAQDWGCAISITDENGKHKEWAILGDPF